MEPGKEPCGVIKTELMYQPSYSLAKVTMDQGDELRVEAGAMVSMNSRVEIETRATGGLMKSLRRSVLGGESFFMNTFRATGANAEVTLAPSLPGDIVTFNLQGSDVLVQSGSFLAAEMAINVETKWGGAKTFFGGEGLFMLRCTGTGQMIVSSYGAIHKVEVPAGETYTVDTGHVVAFDAGMRYQVRKAGSWKSAVFGGEGLVLEFTGPGSVFLQTRSQQAFLSWLIPQLPRDSGN
jgi:uncharacterized protein (TIGR00266 family)